MTDSDGIIDPAALLGGRVASRPRAGSRLRHLDPLVKNSVLMAANVFVASVMGFGFWTIAARWFTPNQVGPVSALFGLIGLASALSTLGMPETVLRFLGSTNDQLGLLARATMRVAGVGLVAGAAVGVGWYFGGTPIGAPAVGLVAIAAITVAANATANVIDSAVVALGRPTILLVETVAGGVAKLALAGLAVSIGLGATGLALALTAAIVIGGIALVACIRRADALVSDHVRPARLRTVRAYSFVNWVGGAASMVPAATVGTLAIAENGPSAAAYIAVPMMIFSAMNVIPSTSARSLFAEASAAPHRLASLTRKTMGFTWVLLVPLALAVAFTAERVLVTFGPDYVANSASALRWLCLASVVAAPNYIGDVVLNVRLDRREYLFANVAGSVFVLVAAFVGARHGVAGIAQGWVVGQVLYGLTVWSMVVVRPFARRRADPSATGESSVIEQGDGSNVAMAEATETTDGTAHSTAHSTAHIGPSRRRRRTFAAPLRAARALPATVAANVIVRLRRWDTGILSVTGRRPRTIGGGAVRIGSRLAVSGTQGRAELGAAHGAILTIGDRVFLNHHASVVAHCHISIGDDCRIGEFAAIFDSDHHRVTPDSPLRVAPVTIGRNVWIGRGALVLPGVTIGDHAVIAAGAIVTKPVPARALVAGNPARVVRDLGRIDDDWRRT